MITSVILTLMLILPCKSKLVITHDEVDDLTIQDLEAHAEIVENKTIPHPTCEEAVQVQVIFKFYVTEEDGSETEELATINADVTTGNREIRNIDEPWVGDVILLR